MSQPNPDGIRRATFLVDGRTIEVDFNPESLTLTFGSQVAQRGTSPKAAGEAGPVAAGQKANTFAATLSMRLVFDSTHTGSNVRSSTVAFQRMLMPTNSTSGDQAKIVKFEWGSAFKFFGTVTTITETVDYFSADGVPLRASIDISMSENRALPEPDPASRGGGGGGFGFGFSAGIEISAQAGISVSAALGGDAFSARAIAEVNGEESLRRLSGASLEIDADVELRGAVAFASGGVSFGASVGVGVSAGASLGVSGGLGLELGAGIGGAGGLGIGGGLAIGSSGSGDGRSGTPAAALGFAGAPPSSAGPSAGAPLGPAQAFAGLTASSPSAAAAAGVRGASSGLLSPGVGSSSPASGVAFGSAARARASANVVAFSTSDPSPTKLEGPAWGSHASAGVPAALGAFSGLQARATPPRIRRRLDPNRLLPPQPDAALHTDEKALFEIGGRAVSLEASGLNTDVGINASLNRRVRFDEE